MITLKHKLSYDEVTRDPIEKALDIIMHETSLKEALEYTADQIEFTRTLGELAATIDILMNGLSFTAAAQKYSEYGIKFEAISAKFEHLSKVVSKFANYSGQTPGIDDQAI